MDQMSTSSTDPLPEINANITDRDSIVSSLQSNEIGGLDANDGKPNRKRKRKGQGSWTRTTVACNRCRKMKIRVHPLRIGDMLMDSVTMYGHVAIASDGPMNVSLPKLKLLK